MKSIQLVLNDRILAELIIEQLAKFCRIAKETEIPDLVIAFEKTGVNAPHLLLNGKNPDGVGNLTMPFRLGDLKDRIAYLLSGRDRFAGEKEIEFGAFRMNADDGLMTNADGNQIRLTDKEKLIIFSLFAAPGHSLDRAELLTLAWGYAETAETHTLETHLYRLRQKIEEGFGRNDLITTKDGIYRLNV